MQETLVILMHSFNSLLWNLAPVSLIIFKQPKQYRVYSGCLALAVAVAAS